MPPTAPTSSPPGTGDAMTADDLHEVGGALFGPRWQREMARALGPLHPDGARESIDDSLVRKWARGARNIPAWVPRALLTIAEARGREIERAATRLRAVLAV